MNKYLQIFRDFYYIFINNIIIFSYTFNNYLLYLNIIFNLLDNLSVTFNFAKIFLTFLFIKLFS